MKNSSRIIAALAAAVPLLGCASQPKQQELAGLAREGSALHPSTAIEHKNSTVGEAIPQWVLMERDAVEQLPEYEGYSIFLFLKDGPDLESLTAWSRSFAASSEIAQEVIARGRDKFTGAPYENKGKVISYAEEAAKIVEVAEYAGALKRDDFWVYMQLYTDKGKPASKIYRCLLLYTVPREQIAAAMQRAFREQDLKGTAMSPDEQAARDWVKALFLEGL
jgi:hypothetical protein